MRRAAAAAALLLPLAGCAMLQPRPEAPARDRWVAEDKARHFFASFAATTLSASAARLAGADPDGSLWVGVGAGAAVGAWKELRDLRGDDGTPSLRDLGWDAAGVAAGALVVREVR